MDDALRIAGFLYLFPIVLAAGFVPRWAVVLLGMTCAVLAEFLARSADLTRLSLEALALTGCGLFLAELVRNRRMSLETEARLRVLVGTSSAAIVTVDGSGFIELANQAANELSAPRDGHLVGNPIAAFLPELHHALRWEENPSSRRPCSAQGIAVTAKPSRQTCGSQHIRRGANPKLAAIIADVTDEAARAGFNPAPTGSDEQVALNTRGLEVLRLLVQGMANKEIAASMGISKSAVKNTLQQLFAKTSVRTRSQLVRVALESHRNLL